MPTPLCRRIGKRIRSTRQKIDATCAPCNGIGKKGDKRCQACRGTGRVRGIALVELARRSGVSRATVSQTESGKHRISADRLWAIAQALEVGIEAFFDGEVGAKNQQPRAENP